MIVCKHCGKIKHKPSKRAKLCYECLIKHKQVIGYNSSPKQSYHFKRLLKLAELFQNKKKKEKQGEHEFDYNIQRDAWV